jgi:aminoglycoside phosphotransferase family enzyme/predicted kinase
VSALPTTDATGLSDGFTPYAELKETHSAVVFLVGDRAYKVKKPVDLGFLDFSSREKRRRAIHRELELNRRLSEDVYLGISEVTDVDGSVLDHLLVMRRMPAERRLAFLIQSGADVMAELGDIADMMDAFHRQAVRGDKITACGQREALMRRWTTNFEQARTHVGRVLDPVQYDEAQRLVTAYLSGRDRLFAHRARIGAIVDGHGDLLAEDIFCLPDGVRVLDCLDFAADLRYLDRIDDMACLVMDLERLGSPAAAEHLLEAYLAASGDDAPQSLVHHYIAYRAFMRAKVACLPGAPDGGTAARLLDLVHRHLEESRMRLVMIGGPPGTGKTTTAEALAGHLDYQLLSSDRVRKELAGVPAETSAVAEFGRGIYTSEWTARTYEEMLQRAEEHLAMGRSVVLDATWGAAEQRAICADIASRTASELTAFCCRLPEVVADERISTRSGISDADAPIAAQVRARFDDWPQAFEIDTREPAEAVVAQALRHLGAGQSTPAGCTPRPSSA